MKSSIHRGDCREVLPGLGLAVDSVVTDPPYGLKFMGKRWDYDVPSVETWAAIMAAMKPGAHLLAFGGTRTYHRLVVNIEDAGFYIRDAIMWHYSTGFPKSLDVAWELHKQACLSCGHMVEYDHEETRFNGNPTKATASRAKRAKQNPEYGMRFVRAMYLQTPVYSCAKCGQVLQPFMQEQGAQKFRTSWQESEIVWPEQPSMEGRSHLEEAEGKLQGCEICEMSTRPIADGAEGWVCRGTSDGYGAIPWQIPNEDGSRPSYRPQSIEQFNRKSNAIQIERRAQKSKGGGTALKPATEIICLARKPFAGTVAENVLKYGTGALNIDACRVGDDEMAVTASDGSFVPSNISMGGHNTGRIDCGTKKGRWPTNLIHDGSEEVLAGLGAAARFFYTVKALKVEREAGMDGERVYTPSELTGQKEGSAGLESPRAGAGGQTSGRRNFHPTIKPIALMQYLIRLVTPPGGTVLDPFLGSGTTGIALARMGAGFGFVGIEKDAKYAAMAGVRINGDVGLFGNIGGSGD